MSAKSYLHIVAAVLTAQDGRILASTRPKGRSMSNRWEFPGGKVESGEGRWTALVRELQEELDLTPTRGRPLIRLKHDYPDGPSVDLDVWRVWDWQGVPRAREGQVFDWFEGDALTELNFLAANTPIVAAARLPDRYLITPDWGDASLIPDGVEAAARGGVGLIQLRGAWLKTGAAESWVSEAVSRARALGTKVVVNGDVDLARAWGADGVHLSARAASVLEQRPMPRPALVGVSCHSAEELRQAEALGADFATLGHVRTTPSHPHQPPLGEATFFALAEDARIPVYAIGGMGTDDIPCLQSRSIQGVAAIRGLWPERDKV
ncbi:8-oxo-dGTP diphosphatase [Natronospira proteinivora]|uniref:8-oxo-dGTP diphosphatase n=1 Tax=Natronospira proteinivora TaxID=1807133 RepID=A0ABT1G4A0_9GAMM|nr:Nudix family hydrolase [Natronospira proteinivora]MCP1726116.1 8-oxo-dGTP diphosphatase [Natronospira proteinivora]